MASGAGGGVGGDSGGDAAVPGVLHGAAVRAAVHGAPGAGEHSPAGMEVSNTLLLSPPTREAIIGDPASTIAPQ